MSLYSGHHGASEPSSSLSPNVWLDAWQDPVANLQAYSQCVKTCDAFGDGDWVLVVANLDKKLKVFKGTSLLSEHKLLETPVGLVVFYSDAGGPRIPTLAVAAGSSVYIYRNLRPYYRFMLPPVDVDSGEKAAWDDFKDAPPDAAGSALVDRLLELRDAGVQLGTQSIEFLMFEDPAARDDFANGLRDKPLVQQTSCTCATSVCKNKAADEPDSVSCPVIGTESGHVIVLDPNGTNMLLRLQLPSTPAFLSVIGLLDVDYRMAVACRTNAVYLVKNGEIMPKAIELETAPCGLAQTSKMVIVACMNRAIHAFHTKGKKAYSLYLPAPVVVMELVSVQRARMVKALIVALGSGEVRVYNDKHLVSVYNTNDSLTALNFGRFGREEHSLVTAGRSGTLSVKILSRKSTLEGAGTGTGPPPEQDVPLSIPKKTKLFVEQTQREVEQAVSMHRLFQQDLCRIRLATARAFVKTLSDTGKSPTGFAASASLRVNATVHGLGPLFKIRFMIVNTGAKTLTNLPVLFSSGPKYVLNRSSGTLPLLVPGLEYVGEVLVNCTDPMGGADAVKITVCSRASCMPVLSAVIKMPLSEPALD